MEKIDFDFGAQDHSLMIVNTGKGHADLSADYSSVPNEMKKVAQYFGKEVCAEISEEEVIENLPEVRAFAGDRSVMRAFHFFEENKRVEQEVKALLENDFAAFWRESLLRAILPGNGFRMYTRLPTCRSRASALRWR